MSSSPRGARVQATLADLWSAALKWDWELFSNSFKDKLDIHGERNAHEVLELELGATEEEVRAAYKRLVKVYHPDRCVLEPEDCSARFQQVQKAMETLSQRAQLRREGRRASPDRTRG